MYSKHHPTTADTFNSMGNVYMWQNEHAKALELFGRALAIREEVHGKHHPDTADTYNNIGLLLKSKRASFFNLPEAKQGDVLSGRSGIREVLWPGPPGDLGRGGESGDVR